MSIEEAFAYALGLGCILAVWAAFWLSIRPIGDRLGKFIRWALNI